MDFEMLAPDTAGNTVRAGACGSFQKVLLDGSLILNLR